MSNILLDMKPVCGISDWLHLWSQIKLMFRLLLPEPEYFETGKATTKGDVYSFGVVLVELLTGKRPSNETFVENGLKLVTWVKDILHERREEYAVDSNLVHSPMGEIKDVFRIAEKCLEADPFQRPSMREVVKMLQKDRDMHHINKKSNSQRTSTK